MASKPSSLATQDAGDTFRHSFERRSVFENFLRRTTQLTSSASLELVAAVDGATAAARVNVGDVARPMVVVVVVAVAVVEAVDFVSTEPPAARADNVGDNGSGFVVVDVIVIVVVVVVVVDVVVAVFVATGVDSARADNVSAVALDIVVAAVAPTVAVLTVGVLVELAVAPVVTEDAR